jgi:hypothetical protein
MSSNSTYHENLTQTVISKSIGTTWHDAVQEWEIVDCIEDDELESSCICGKENLKYLFTIKNQHNQNYLSPIGSSCIKKFQRSDLNDFATVNEQLFKLLHAIENNQFLTLSSELFSRKLLKYLFDAGAFKASSYNNFYPEKEYRFLLKMFNKRDKDSITDKQQRYISAIILNSIKPFLQSMLASKIKRKR